MIKNSNFQTLQIFEERGCFAIFALFVMIESHAR
jgi:hypothetical protein